VYVRPFPDTDRGRWQVSTTGGTQPMWSRNTQELFYVVPGPGNELMSVRFDPGEKWIAGSPVRVLAGPYFGAGNTGRTYDVSTDGKRFLVTKAVAGPDEAADAPQLVIVQHVFAELRRLAPAK
jgi:serine/threonine-protein kinase